jgi:hypothetical protein
MCGYCFEAAALHYMEQGETNVSRDLSFEPVRLYRPGMPVDREAIAREWRKIPDDREREITALNLWLRDNDDLLIRGLDTVALPCTEGEDQLYLRPSEGMETALETLNLWYECVLAPALNHMQQVPGGIKGLSRPEYTWSLLLAVHLNRLDDSDWLYMVRRLSLDWGQIGALAAFAGDLDGKSVCPSPTFADLRLWLRREARLALWRAGFREEAAFHDEREDLLNFLEWLNLAGEQGAAEMIEEAKPRDFWLS